MAGMVDKNFFIRVQGWSGMEHQSLKKTFQMLPSVRTRPLDAIALAEIGILRQRQLPPLDPRERSYVTAKGRTHVLTQRH
jgi:hypothetical protein